MRSRVAAVAQQRHAVALYTCCRAQSLLNDVASGSNSGSMLPRHSKAAYRHPLAPRDPAQRNVAIPASAHAAARSVDAQSPIVLRRRAQRALLQQMQQEVLWEGTVLDSADHALMQHFVRLARNPKYRAARQLMLVGGRELIRELCARGHTPRHLLITDGAVVPAWARQLRGVELVRVTRPVAERCVPGNDGFVGEFAVPPPPAKERLIVNAQRYTRVLVLDNVDDAGVLGTLLRTACGMMYDAIIATNHCADLYDNRVVRAARGAHFQTAVPIYTLREEDGDDVYGMINHVLRRNELLPLCYAAQDDGAAAATATSSPAVFVSSVVGAAPVVLPTTSASNNNNNNNGSHRGGGVLHTTERLSEFCLRHFTALTSPPQEQQTPSASSTTMQPRLHERSGARERGYVLFVGPNHTRTMLQRLPRRVAAPMTRLLLDDDMPSSTDALIGYSLVLHALRPRGEWDYMPLPAYTDEQQLQQVTTGAARASSDNAAAAATTTTSARGAELQTQFMSVDLGPNRLCLDETHLSMDEDEQRHAADERNALKKWSRLHRRRLSDREHWLAAEERRIAAAHWQQRTRAYEPWATLSQTKDGRQPVVRGAPEWVPNLIDEYRTPLDRDALREERERSEAFVRPESNYPQRQPRK